MKRVFAGLLLATALAGRLAAQPDAVALAAQREMEENVRRLQATINEVQTAQEQQHKEIEELRAAVQQLRSDLGKLNQSAIIQELQNTIRKLDDKIMKVDESRASDSKRIFEALKELGKLVAERPAMPQPPSISTPPPPVRNGSDTPTAPSTGGQRSGNTVQEGYEYTIAPGDTLSEVVQRYREKNIPVTQKMVEEANPNVKWNRLRVGQKIFIPKPK